MYENKSILKLGLHAEPLARFNIFFAKRMQYLYNFSKHNPYRASPKGDMISGIMKNFYE